MNEDPLRASSVHGKSDSNSLASINALAWLATLLSGTNNGEALQQLLGSIARNIPHAKRNPLSIALVDDGDGTTFPGKIPFPSAESL